MQDRNYSNLFCLMFICILTQAWVISGLFAREKALARITVSEVHGLARSNEYVTCSLAGDINTMLHGEKQLVALDSLTQAQIPVQVFDIKTVEPAALSRFSVVFPVSMNAGETKMLQLKAVSADAASASSDLKLSGEGLELIIENEFFRADLTRREAPEPKIHPSGQLQELRIKMGFDQLLTNEEDRIHWAPNFKREELEYYTTIAHWVNPREYRVDAGSYLVQTVRRDTAPDHPEIMLTAVYQFFAGVPYFKFYSEMSFVEDLPLELLRNDEMTTDSMFTHVAFQRPGGETVDIALAERHELLQRHPIEDDAHWICFYNIDHGFAFGSIRLRYDNHNEYGGPSPTYRKHTQIGEWMGRKYWNRRLIHDRMIYIPKGSRYLEENAYLVFKIGETDRFENIRYWAERLRRPLQVNVSNIGE